FQAEDGIRDFHVTGVQTCALPISPAGTPEAACDIPDEAGLEDVSNPTTVVGDGTPESCTADAFIDAVARGGIITFDCGPDPVTKIGRASCRERVWMADGGVP